MPTAQPNIQLPDDQSVPFHLFIERQADGRHMINMAPEAVLMRPLPLAFFLSGDEARRTADELYRYAALVDAPGTLPAEIATKEVVA